MINTYRHKDLVWVDIESPTKEEVRQVMQEFGIHPLAAEGLLLPSMKQKVDLYKDFIYLSLHFPVIRHSHRQSVQSQEVDFIIGKNFIITTRFDSIDPLHQFSKIFEVNSILDKSHVGDHAGFIFYHMIREIYRSLVNELAFINDSLKAIERDMFSGKEREMVIALSKVSRDVIQLKGALDLHGEVLKSLEQAGATFYNNEFNHYLAGITSEYCHVAHIADSELEIIRELRETNNSLLTTKQNAVMQKISVFAFIAIPLSISTSLFQIETVSRPIVGQENDFWIILTSMVIFAILLYLFLRSKKWL